MTRFTLLNIYKVYITCVKFICSIHLYIVNSKNGCLNMILEGLFFAVWWPARPTYQPQSVVLGPVLLWCTNFLFSSNIQGYAIVFLYIAVFPELLI